MIEAIHFNDENKNILLPNKKENLVKVYEGNKWVDSKYNIIDDH
jgi:hypothetical protein